MGKTPGCIDAGAETKTDMLGRNLSGRQSGDARKGKNAGPLAPIQHLEARHHQHPVLAL